MDSIEVMESKVRIFNDRHPVGSKVIVIKDFGEQVEDVIKWEATIMGGHTAMAWLKDNGSYCLDRVF